MHRVKERRGVVSSSSSDVGATGMLGGKAGEVIDDTVDLGEMVKSDGAGRFPSTER